MDGYDGCGKIFINGVQDWHDCALKRKSMALCLARQWVNPNVASWEKRKSKTTRPDFFTQRVFWQFFAKGISFTYNGSCDNWVVLMSHRPLLAALGSAILPLLFGCVTVTQAPMDPRTIRLLWCMLPDQLRYIQMAEQCQNIEHNSNMIR